MSKSWPHFSADELDCKDGTPHQMKDSFMDRLERLRDAYNKPMRLSSAYRSPEYNAKVSTTGRSGPHTTGRAVDVLISGKDAYDLILLALQMGFTGIGISQKGAHESRYIHLDDLPNAPGQPRPTIWSY